MDANKPDSVSASQPRQETPEERRRRLVGAKTTEALRSAELPSTITDPDFWARVVRLQFAYSLCGLILGLICTIGGIVLFLNGVAGSTNWTAKMIGLEGTLSDAAPGSLLFVVGLFVVWATRLKFNIKKS